MEWAWFREGNVPTSCDLRWRNKDSLSSKTHKLFFLHMIYIKQGVAFQTGSLSFLTGRPVQLHGKDLHIILLTLRKHMIGYLEKLDYVVCFRKEMSSSKVW